ncbi:high-affinity lysophosphatidic acid receptor-like [Orbicella faveolata]|uniref:high-affinity lysophosphatidic acid receptor-like n=1 Tax=Orbicella faveolata TaxID=48498 RepID=UPI0009E35AC1|nr:high-affinity lysophosphatidic acid receptor-like [Orbicella faveolata]
MAAANFTGDGQQKTVQQLMCSAGLTAGLHGQLTFISVLNTVLSVTAFLGNALILIALHKESSSLHPPSKLLLRSLATADLCVGLFAEPLSVGYWMSEVNEHWNICPYLSLVSFVTSYILCGVSFATLTELSVDRLLALLLGLRYRQVVTLKRTYLTVITTWVIAAVFSGMVFWNPLITLWYGTIGIPLYLIISIFSYTKIFLTLHHRNTQIHSHNVQQPNQTNQLNIGRYKKAVSTVIWLQLTLVACYLPHGVVTTLWAKSGLSVSVYHARIYTATLIFLNSSLNPILYCWKLDEVRQAVKDTVRKVLRHCFTS